MGPTAWSIRKRSAAESPLFLFLMFLSTDKHILETTYHKYRQPWTALKMLSGGSPSVLRATLFMLRYRGQNFICWDVSGSICLFFKLIYIGILAAVILDVFNMYTLYFSGFDWSAAVWKSRWDVWQVYWTGTRQCYHICSQGVGFSLCNRIVEIMCLRCCHLSLNAQFMSSLLQLQWKQDLDQGLELISKAIEIDNKCDFAYETMGTIEVQRWDKQLLHNPHVSARDNQ